MPDPIEEIDGIYSIEFRYFAAKRIADKVYGRTRRGLQGIERDIERLGQINNHLKRIGQLEIQNKQIYDYMIGHENFERGFDYNQILQFLNHIE